VAFENAVALREELVLAEGGTVEASIGVSESSSVRPGSPISRSRRCRLDGEVDAVEGHRDELVEFDAGPIHPAEGREPLRFRLAEAFDCLEGIVTHFM